MAKNRRKKNLSERKRDIADRDESFAKIGQMYYDQLRKHYNSANWVNKRLKEDYVSDNLQGCWETTTHSHIYTDSP